MKTLRIAALASLAFSVACGNACEDYFEAAESCFNDAFGGDSAGLVSFDLDGYCDTDAAKELDKSYFQCAADAFNNGDCSTLEGYTAAATEVAGCTAG